MGIILLTIGNMPQQFVVPQFIDEEAKIIGSITGRQFIIMMVAVFVAFIIYKLADFALMLTINIPLILFAIILSFVKIRGQKFHFFLLNFISTQRKKKVRAWMKTTETLTMKVEAPEDKKKNKQEPVPQKKPATKSRLTELSLVVNTGGLYHPDEE